MFDDFLGVLDAADLVVSSGLDEMAVGGGGEEVRLARQPPLSQRYVGGDDGVLLKTSATHLSSGRSVETR